MFRLTHLFSHTCVSTKQWASIRQRQKIVARTMHVPYFESLNRAVDSFSLNLTHRQPHTHSQLLGTHSASMGLKETTIGYLERKTSLWAQNERSSVFSQQFSFDSHWVERFPFANRVIFRCVLVKISFNWIDNKHFELRICSNFWVKRKNGENLNEKTFILVKLFVRLKQKQTLSVHHPE